MRAELVECTVADIAAPIKNALVGGPFGSNLVSKDYVDSGVPVIRGQNMGGRWVSGDYVFVSNEKAEALSSNAAYPGDIIFTQRGTLGQVAIVPDRPYGKYIVSQSQMKLTVDREKADILFLYYLFSSPEHQGYIKSNSIQVGVPHTNLGVLKNTPVKLPDLEAQQKIAKVLSVLDYKIENNRQINKTLKLMAQAIFKSWFVDFDPVRAKMAGRQPGGMDAVTAALFPGDFVESEKGPIPRGWSYKKASEVVDLSIGKTPPRKESEWFSESVDDVKWISIRDMGSSGVYVLNTSECLTEEAVEKFNVRRVKDNTVILSFKLTVGRVAITVGEMLTNEAIAHFNVRGGAPLCSEYLYLYLLGFDYSSLGSTSSIATAVNSATIKNMPILCAAEPVVLAFRHVVEPFFEKIKLLEQQNALLSDARDVLLPRLLSGELVPDFRVS